MAKGQDYTLKFTSDEVAGVSIHKSKNGYNYADLNIKRSNDQYIRISYEWSGDKLPDFAMDVLGYIQINKEGASISDEVKKEIAEFKERLEKACQ